MLTTYLQPFGSVILKVEGAILDVSCELCLGHYLLASCLLHPSRFKNLHWVHRIEKYLLGTTARRSRKWPLKAHSPVILILTPV